MPVVLAPGAKRPDVAYVPSAADVPVIVVHEHSYASIAFAVSRAGRGEMRTAHPCCAKGCPNRWDHEAIQCASALALAIDAWPVSRRFPDPTPLDEAWADAARAWMRTRRMAYVIDFPSMLGPRGEPTEPLPPAHTPRLLASPIPALPSALVEGLVPFAPAEVARYALDVLRQGRKATYEMRAPPGFERGGDGVWRAITRPLPGESFVRAVPHGVADVDFGAQDSGTWAEPRYETHGAPAVVGLGPWRARVAGETFDDPRVYVREWVRARLHAMAMETARAAERKRARDAFIRSVFVGKTFLDAYGNRKKEYIQESKTAKRVRASNEFGPELAAELLALPISEFGPDFEEDSESEPDEEEYDLEDSAPPTAKDFAPRIRVQPPTHEDTLERELSAFV